MIAPKSKIQKESARAAGWWEGWSPKSKNGFTIIEALVSIFVLSMGITACIGLASSALRSSEISKNRLIAANLAQEGIEVVRNIRDSNWLASQNFDYGLSDNTNPGYQAQYNSTSLSTYDGSYLKIDSNGVYSYSGATTTTFQRKITISHPQTYEIEINCYVYWTTKGVSNQILMTEHLYDWK